MLAVYKKEMRSYFTSIIGWLFLGFFLLFVGLYHYLYNMYYAYSNFAYALSGVYIFFILLVPMLTMRIMAEENKQKTDQLLFTSPISISKIILGKFLALISIFGIGILVICVYPLALSRYGEVNMKWSYAAIMGFFLLGAAYMSIGLFISSMTESQALAAVLTFITIIVTLFVDGIASILPTDDKTAWIFFAVVALVVTLITYLLMKNILVSSITAIVLEAALAVLYFVHPAFYDGLIVRVFGWFSVVARYDDFSSGILNISDVVYYLSVITLFVFLTIQSIKKRRWS